jgi:hypothetical protein
LYYRVMRNHAKVIAKSREVTAKSPEVRKESLS